MKDKMKNGDSDLETQETLKTERTRRVLKWAILVSVLTLLAIVAVAIPMALKTVPTTTTSAASDFDPSRPNDQGTLDPLDLDLPTTTPYTPSPAPITTAPTETEPPQTMPTKSPAPTDDRPSLRPTNNPTAPPPTPKPTRGPTANPTTLAPTFTPLDRDYAFKLRLFWQSGYYWQESWDEVWHCVECTKCTSYGAGDGWEHGCEKRGDGNSLNCEAGDMFWIDKCDGRGSEFNILTNPGSGYQVRLAGSNLCIRRGAIDGETGLFKNRLLKAEKCDANDASQLWAPFPSLSKFELRPLSDVNKDEDNAECVSQLHHPKNSEVLSLHGCKLSRIYETRYWEEL